MWGKTSKLNERSNSYNYNSQLFHKYILVNKLGHLPDVTHRHFMMIFLYKLQF